MPLDQEQWRWVQGKGGKRPFFFPSSSSARTRAMAWSGDSIPLAGYATSWPAIGVPSGGVTSARPNAALMLICWCPGALVVVVASFDFAGSSRRHKNDSALPVVHHGGGCSTRGNGSRWAHSGCPNRRPRDRSPSETFTHALHTRSSSTLAFHVVCHVPECVVWAECTHSPSHPPSLTQCATASNVTKHVHG
jgi:hypothetical protein